MQGKVEICGINTAKLEVLKNDEMTELLRRTKQGDMDARERLIRGNLRLVLSVLQRFTSRGENMDDLFQVGCIGLIKAIDNFDITQPVRFSTYGVPMIVGEIRRYLRDNSAVRVSRSLRDKTTPRLIQFHILKNAVNPPFLGGFLFSPLWRHRQNGILARTDYTFWRYSVTIEKLSLQSRAIVKMYKNVRVRLKGLTLD